MRAATVSAREAWEKRAGGEKKKKTHLFFLSYNMCVCVYTRRVSGHQLPLLRKHGDSVCVRREPSATATPERYIRVLYTRVCVCGYRNEHLCHYHHHHHRH